HRHHAAPGEQRCKLPCTVQRPLELLCLLFRGIQTILIRSERLHRASLPFSVAEYTPVGMVNIGLWVECDILVYHLTGSRSIIALNHCVRISEPAKIKVMQTPRKVPAIHRARMSVVLSTVIRVCRM